jgi:acetate kinase
MSGPAIIPRRTFRVVALPPPAGGEGLSPPEAGELVNRHAGLVRVSETSAGMRDLLGREASDLRAAEAVAIFCYQAKKFLGALAAALGGLDTLIFTGGIGEHAAPVRWRICEGLEFLGLRLDGGRNAEHAPVVSCDGSPVTVRVISTDENVVIARHTHRLVRPTTKEGRSVK